MSAKEILNKCLTDFKALKLKKISYNEYYVLYKLKYNKNKYLIKISIISNIDHEIKDIKNKFNIKHKYLNCFYSVIDTENLIYEKFKDLEYNNGLYKYFGLTKDCHLIESEEFKDELDEIKDTYGVGIKDNKNKLLGLANVDEKTLFLNVFAKIDKNNEDFNNVYNWFIDANYLDLGDPNFEIVKKI